MKKTTTLILLTILITFSDNCKAQVSIGVNAGLNLGKLVSEFQGISISTKRLPTFTAGIPVEIRISEMFALQPELTYITKGGKSTSSDYFNGNSYTYESEIKINYLEVPILGKFSFGSPKIKFDMFVGPVFGYGLSGSTYERTVVNGSVSEDNNDINFEDDNINRFDFSLSFGAGTSLTAGVSKFCFRIQYQTGLSNMDNSDPTTNGVGDFMVTNNNFIFALGFLTPISSPKPKPILQSK